MPLTLPEILAVASPIGIALAAVWRARGERATIDQSQLRLETQIVAVGVSVARVERVVDGLVSPAAAVALHAQRLDTVERLTASHANRIDDHHDKLADLKTAIAGCRATCVGPSRGRLPSTPPQD